MNSNPIFFSIGIILGSFIMLVAFAILPPPPTFKQDCIITEAIKGTEEGTCHYKTSSNFYVLRKCGELNVGDTLTIIKKEPK